MADTPITAEQLKKLQTLYSQFAAASPDARTRGREERLMWVSFVVGRTVDSFNALTMPEAKKAIDALKKTLGKKAKPRMDGERARRFAKDGRYDGDEFKQQPKMAEAFELEIIEGYYARLGWTRETFDAWLRSPRSPLGRRSHPQLRTVADCNRVRWALKRMLRRQGLWEERAAS